MRRDLLASSIRAVRDGKQSAAGEAEAKPRKLAGVLDVQRGLDQLRSGAPQPIDTALIAESAIRDRFDVRDGLDELISSIRQSGQKLPVLLRRTHGGPLPYEVVYGRRRIEACRQLGIPVQAYVSEMNDRDALISQGLENAARLQRSFIEQAVYADRLLKHGLTRDDVMEVLAVDKTTISRMLGVVNAVPAAVIEAIGPAHDSGRRPWQALREAIEARPDVDEGGMLAMIDRQAASHERLAGLLRALQRRPDAAPRPAPIKRRLPQGAQLERDGRRLVLKCTAPELTGFDEFLDARMEGLLAEFLARKESGRG